MKGLNKRIKEKKITFARSIKESKCVCSMTYRFHWRNCVLFSLGFSRNSITDLEIDKSLAPLHAAMGSGEMIEIEGNVRKLTQGPIPRAGDGPGPVPDTGR